MNYDLDAEHLSHRDILIEAKKRGLYLRSSGLRQSDRLALILPDNKDFVLWFLGAIAVGVVPVPIIPPIPGARLERTIDRILHILNSCQARTVVTSRTLSSFGQKLKENVPVLEGLIFSDSTAASEHVLIPNVDAEPSIKPSDCCFIQYTSGSTGDPKGVIVSHQNVLANVFGIIDIIKLDVETEQGICWLPLYHDMGLIGHVLLPTIAHSSNVFLSPLTFITRPESWMQAVSAYRGTISASPNFGLALATKCVHRVGAIDLSSLKTIICGAEPVNPNTVRAFIKAFRPYGLNDKAVKPAYGMAEATLCITLTEREATARELSFERESYEKNRIMEEHQATSDAECVEVVSCGPVLPGHRIAIMRDDGTIASDGEVGEVIVEGPSVTTGYFRDAEATTELFIGNWMKTGDFGFIHNGDLFISGRKKDLIIVAGKNYHPHSIEWCVEKVPGIRAGRVVAFSIPAENTEKVIVVAECKILNSLQQLVHAVKSRVAEEFGVSVSNVIFVEKGSLPKTSSGKLQRAMTKKNYQSGLLRHLDAD